MTATPDIVDNRRLPWYRAFYPYLLLMLANFFWASNWVMGRAMHDSFPPVALSFWRWGCAAVVIAPFALPRLRGQWPIVWRHRWLFLVFGFTGVATFQSLIYAGLNYTTAVNASLINASSPLIMIAMVWAIERQTATRRQLLGMALSFVGLVLIIAHGDLASLWSFQFNTGDILIFFSIPLWCLYSILLRHRPSGVDSIGFLLVLMLVGLVFLAPACVYEGVFVRVPVWNFDAVAGVVYAGISSSVLAYIFWNRGVEQVGPNRAVFTSPFQPAFAAILAVIILGEPFELYHAIGFAVIFAGWFLTTDRKAKA